MKFGKIILQANSLRIDGRSRIFDMTSCFQDGSQSHEVISSSKVLPPGEWTHGVCPALVQQRPTVPAL